VGWCLAIVGGVIVGGISLTGVMSSSVTKIVIITLGSISALGIFILNDLHRNPFANFGIGVWNAYNTATGLLGDTLSYLRLYALGLAGGMLGNAFNALASSMIQGGNASIGGWIGFVLILLFGHTLNIAMSCLGAFVHPLRLNFLEFFKNSAYVGQGREYKPLQ
jgi:V/A-type H+-transporting ATPase subunit I